MGLAESAAILLGIGIISQRFGAGLGLEQLGVGVRTLAGAPLGGVGLGLGEFSGGLRSLAEALGDIGRGFGTLFENLPKLPPSRQYPEEEQPPTQETQYPTLPFSGVQAYVGQISLSPKSGGDYSTLLTGGGGNVPKAPTSPRLPSLPTGPFYLDRNVSMVDERHRAVTM